MKINKSNFYSLLFVIVLFLQLYLPSFKANIFVQIVALLIYFFFEKNTIEKTLFKVITPLLLIFLLGFLGTFIHKYKLFNISKDIFHFIKPILGILIGYLFFKQIKSFKRFVKIIVLIGFLSAIIHFITVILFSKTETVSDIREFAKDNFLELFALLFLVYFKKFTKENLFKYSSNYKVIFIILLLSNVLYFSRTMMITAIIVILSIYGYTKITTKTIKILSLLILFIGLFYAYLFSIKIDRKGNSFESFLYKVKIAPSEIFKTKIDRDDHKDLWDHWRGYEAKRAFALMNDNPSSYIIGLGYGSLVNLKFYAPLTGNNKDKGLKYISELHNGFPYILYKLGFLGLFIYLYLLLKLYKFIYLDKSFTTVFISSIGLFYIFSTITISGMYNTKDCVVIILGCLLYFYDTNKKENNA